MNATWIILLLSFVARYLGVRRHWQCHRARIGVNTSLKCQCPERPFVLRGHERDLPVDTLERIGERNEGWAFLYRCKECGQLWHVDRWDKLQVLLCFKISDLENWSEADDEAMRIGYLIKARGGNGDETCSWRGCEKKALKSLAFCAHHAFHEMGARE